MGNRFLYYQCQGIVFFSKLAIDKNEVYSGKIPRLHHLKNQSDYTKKR